MTLTDLVLILSDLANVVVTLLLAYAVYKIAKLIETLDWKIKKEPST
jgi:hypothetical protein